MNWLKRISLKQNRALKWLYCSIGLAFARLLNEPLVLCFHRVKIPSGSLLDRRVGVTKPSDLVEVIRFLRMAGYHFVGLETLVKMVEEGNFQRVAAVTFDDGFNDLFTNAFPILKQYNIPFTCFLISSLINSTELLWLHRFYIAWDRVDESARADIISRYVENDHRMRSDDAVTGHIVHSQDKETLIKLANELSDLAKISRDDEARFARDLYLRHEEIEAMQADGLKIELHGHNHWPLARLSQEEARREMETSLTIFRGTFQTQPRFLALPYGISNPYLRNIATTLGIRGIFTMRGELLTAHNKDFYNLPRFCIYNNTQAFYRSLSVELIKCGVARFSRN